MELTHINEQGRARMVDVGNKPESARRAIASALVRMRPETLQRIRSGGIAKGDVLAVAQVAGVMAAKRTPELIPMCHPLPLDAVDISFHFQEPSGLLVTAEVSCTGRTGVEMEAMTAAAVAALTVYDMCKAVDRWMQVDEVRLLAKSGGKSGSLVRPGEGDAVGARGTVVSVCVSPERGQLKRPVEEAELVAGFGLAGDGHGGDWERQVSLLALESIERAARERGIQVGPGDFAENLTTRGIDIASLPVGTRLKVGEQAVLQVTQIGKEDHESVVTRTLGFSLIPREGAFARVLVGGAVRPGDTVEVLEDE